MGKEGKENETENDEYPPAWVPTLYDKYRQQQFPAKLPMFDSSCALVLSTIGFQRRTDNACCEIHGCLLECQGFKFDGWECAGQTSEDGCRSGLTGPNQTSEIIRFGCPKCKEENEEYYLCEKCFWHQEKFRGRITVDDEQMKHLFEEIDQDNLGPGGQEATLDIEELKAFCGHQGKGRSTIEGYPAGVHGLLYPNQLSKAFRKFDEDNSGSMSADEWTNFLLMIEFNFLRFCLQNSHIQLTAFFARGQPWATSQDRSDVNGGELDIVKACAESSTVIGRNFQCSADPDCKGGFIPPGWWADFVYYNANIHPLLGIIGHDPHHTLDKTERICMEISTIGLVVIIETRRRLWDVSWQHGPAAGAPSFFANPYVFAVWSGIIPLLSFYFLFFMFNCPWALVDDYKATEEEKRKAERNEWWCTFAGRSWMLTLIGGAILTLVFHHNEISPEIVIMARMNAYIFHVLLAFFLTFNPWLAWGSPDTTVGESFFVDLVGLGQWRIEKQRFQARCRRVTEIYKDLMPLHHSEAGVRLEAGKKISEAEEDKLQDLIDPTAAHNVKQGRTAGGIFSYSGVFFSQVMNYNCCGHGPQKRKVKVKETFGDATV